MNKPIKVITPGFILSAFSLFFFATGIYVARNELPPYSWAKEIRTVFLKQQADRKNGWEKIDTEVIRVSGLPAFFEDGDYSRLPERISSHLRKPLRDLERNTSGGVATFETTSSRLRIVATVEANRSPLMSFISAGFDIYEDGRYRESVLSNSGFLDVEVDLSSDKKKAIEVFFPLYGVVRDFQIFSEVGSVNSRPKAPKGTVVYYGSSITQGCCASNPAMSYPAIVSRNLGLNQINLGFSGNGLGDLELADYIIELSPDLVVLDYWANPSAPEYSSSLPKFIEQIRDGLPVTPIIVTSTFANPGREKTQALKDISGRRVVTMRRTKGDINIFFADCLLNQHEADGLIDARHLNSFGFSIVAKKLTAFILENDLVPITQTLSTR